MATPVSHGDVNIQTPGEGRRIGPRLTSGQVWQAVGKAMFAAISYVTPSGEPRSSGVVYKTIGHRLYVAVAPDSWKAKHIAASGRVAVVVPVRRGEILSLVLPIPPATISFHGAATVHKADAPEIGPLLDQLAPLLPADRRASSVLIEIVPDGEFLTYGVGVSLMKMRTPATARGRAPVS